MRTRPSHLRAMLSFALFLLATLALAKEFPEKPIRLVVPYPAGGSTDQLARIIQKPMREYLGQPVVVENKPGAGAARRSGSMEPSSYEIRHSPLGQITPC